MTIRLQPSVGDRVVYLALGPTNEGGTRQWKLVVGVRITNNEPQDIALTGVRFTFPSSQVPEAVMYRPDLVTDPIPPGQSAWWSSGVVGIPNTKESKYNAVNHDLPAPAGVRIHLQFAGYTQEIAIAAPLVRHEAPVAGKGYRFPFLGARSGTGRVVRRSSPATSAWLVSVPTGVSLVWLKTAVTIATPTIASMGCPCAPWPMAW